MAFSEKFEVYLYTYMYLVLQTDTPGIYLDTRTIAPTSNALVGGAKTNSTNLKKVSTSSHGALCAARARASTCTGQIRASVRLMNLDAVHGACEYEYSYLPAYGYLQGCTPARPKAILT